MQRNKVYLVSLYIRKPTPPKWKSEKYRKPTPPKWKSEKYRKPTPPICEENGKVKNTGNLPPPICEENGKVKNTET